jgi:hypothetical protein
MKLLFLCSIIETFITQIFIIGINKYLIKQQRQLNKSQHILSEVLSALDEQSKKIIPNYDNKDDISYPIIIHKLI